MGRGAGVRREEGIEIYGDIFGYCKVNVLREASLESKIRINNFLTCVPGKMSKITYYIFIASLDLPHVK